MTNTILVSMAELFRIAGYDHQTVEPYVVLDVSEQKIRIKCFDHDTGQVTKKLVTSLVRKGDVVIYEVRTRGGVVLLRASGEHRIYDTLIEDYVALRDVSQVNVLLSTGEQLPVSIVRTNDIEPVLDMEVEGVANYFANSILSHNTSPGGNALRFYASVRLDIRRTGSVAEGDDKTGITARVKIVKSKVCPPFQTAEIIIRFGEGIDAKSELINLAIQHKLVKKNGSWLAYGDQLLGQGMRKAADALDTLGLTDEVRMKIIDASTKGGATYEENSSD